MSDGDMVGKDLSDRRRDSVSLFTSLTGTLVNSGSTSKETRISFLVRWMSLIDWTKLEELMI